MDQSKIQFEQSLAEYLKLDPKYLFVPLHMTVASDMLTPVRLYQTMRSFARNAYLIESVQQNEQLGRYSVVGVEPLIEFFASADQVSIQWMGQPVQKHQQDPITAFFGLMRTLKDQLAPGPKEFPGGAIGYFGYDSVRHIEKIQDKNPDDIQIPESFFIVPATVFVFDHIQQTLHLIIYVKSQAKEAYAAALKKAGRLLKQTLLVADSQSPSSIKSAVLTAKDYKSNLSKPAYLKAVKRAQEHIKEGDVYQVVVSQRFQMPYTKDPFEIYRALRRINPSPYLYFLEYPGFCIAGSSPEILVKKEDRKLTLRPIAGTKKRGATQAIDAQLAKEMQQDPKEIAEHMMLLDLGRNDLGKVSRFGSVKADPVLTVDYYSHVMHLVSTIQSEANPDVDAEQVFRAAFPAGTLTGAPKVSAMQIIDQLEISRRCFYGGAVVYFKFPDDLDSCIGIRSVIVKEGMAYVQAGGGIVADSVPEHEYLESLNKAKALMTAVKTSMENDDSTD